jgi:hypothetical protein
MQEQEGTERNNSNNEIAKNLFKQCNRNCVPSCQHWQYSLTATVQSLGSTGKGEQNILKM